MAAIIETKQLTHTYSQGPPFQHTALDSVDFSAQPGEYLAIIGRTGRTPSPFQGVSTWQLSSKPNN